MKKLTKQKITEKLHKIASENNAVYLNDYKSAKDLVTFLCLESNIKISVRWDNIRYRKKIPRRNNSEYQNYKLHKICTKYNLTPLEKWQSYINTIKYKCNNCNHIFNKRRCDITHCTNCNNLTKYNKGINTKTVLRNPYIDYYLYFVYLNDYDCYKIGLYKKKYIKSRFSNTNFKLINLVKLPLYKAYYLEQLIIKQNENNKYNGEKFGGYTEAFCNADEEYIKKLMGASIKDVEPHELLENLETDNQQLSL